MIQTRFLLEISLACYGNMFSRCFFSFFGSATAPGNVPRFRHRHMEALKSPDLNINTATIPSHVDHHSVPPFVQ